MEPPPASPAADPDAWWWVLDPRRSLRARATLLAGGTAILFTGITLFLVSNTMRREVIRQLGTTNAALAFQMGDKLERSAYDRFRQLQAMAILPPFHGGVTRAEDARRWIQALQDTTPDFAWIGYANRKGEIIAGSRGWMEGTNIEARSIFHAANDGNFVGLDAWQPLMQKLPPPNMDQPRFPAFAIPVPGNGNEPGGVLLAYLSWDWAKEIQHSVVFDRRAREARGSTIYNTNAVDALLDSAGDTDDRPPPAPGRFEARISNASIVEQMDGTTSFVTGYARTNAPDGFRGLGWFVTVRQPLANALAPVVSLERSLALWGITFCVIAACLAWFTADRIARRMRIIALSADRIRTGDIQTVMPSHESRTEVGRMSRALFAMVETLRQKKE